MWKIIKIWKKMIFMTPWPVAMENMIRQAEQYYANRKMR